MKKIRRKIIRKRDQRFVDNCVNLPITSLSKTKTKKIAFDYLSIARKTLLAGFEWKFPLIGTVKIVRCEKNPKTGYLASRHVLIGTLWYRLDITPDKKFDNMTFHYKMSDTLRNEMKKLLLSKQVEYRYQP